MRIRTLRFLALPAAIARNVWQWLTDDPATRWARLTGDDDA